MNDRAWVIAGCMTGTSIDAIDVAVCRIALDPDDVTFLGGASMPMGSLGDDLRHVASGGRTTAGDIAAMALRLGELHLEALRPLVPPGGLDLVVAHGQTVFHVPPRSWQLLNPFPIAAGLGVRVLSDLRQGDLALGGEGAPITPRADALLYRRAGPSAAVVNLGGFCNVTRLTDPPTGGDVCACNHVLDGLARVCLGRPFDDCGSVAASGSADAALVASLGERLGAQARAARSLGTGDELGDWIEARRGDDGPVVLASACESIARGIGVAVGDADPVILSGGGVRNRALETCLRSCCSGLVETSDDYGIPASHREACAMAVLGALALAGLPTTLPGVTRRRAGPVVVGSWTGP